MGRSQESFNKKAVRNKKEKKRKEKEQKRQARKEEKNDNTSFDDMIAYVDEFGNITDTPPDPDEREEVPLEEIEISPPKKEDLPPPDPNRKGIVSYFNEAKGYGFIRDKETQESVFVHVNDTQEEIREGNAVAFVLGEGKKGPVALEVKIDR